MKIKIVFKLISPIKDKLVIKIIKKFNQIISKIMKNKKKKIMKVKFKF